MREHAAERSPTLEGLTPEECCARLWERGDVAAIDRLLADAAALPSAQLIGVLMIDQWHRWHRAERIPAEHYLQRYPVLANDAEEMLALVYGEYLVREGIGETPPADEYIQRFPTLAARFRQQLELHAALESASTIPGEQLPPLPETRIVAPEEPAGYEIIDELGRGSMGVVYRAWQTALRRQVALKRLLNLGDAAPATLARFRTEAEAVARLHHPNIVQVYAFGEDASRPFFTMELVEGATLASLVRKGPLPVRQAAELIATLARAIHYAHGRGVLHRDLKPANVLLTADGTPKITDFGLAKLLVGGTEQTASGAMLGTPAYMAPEQAGQRSATLGPVADVYALGAILYELLTGRTPFWADSAVDMLLQVRIQEPIPPRRLRPGLPRDLETICLKCLQKRPVLRYASAAELAEDLDRYLRGEPICARPIGRLVRVWRWCRRNPALAGVGGLAAAGLLISAVVSASFGIYHAHAAKRLGKALAEADHLTATLALDRGLSLCDQGDTGPGLLWLARSLELASRTDDADLQRAIRINLSAWSNYLHPLRACLRHRNRVKAVAFSPDNTRLATVCIDGTAQLWDAATGVPIGAAMQHRGSVTVVAFSTDGSRLITGCADGSAYRWDAVTGAPLSPRLMHGAPVEHLLFDGPGRWCLTAGGKEVRVWDLASGKAVVALPHEAAITAAAIRPDGTSVLTGTDNGTVALWDLPAGVRRGNLPRHGSRVGAAALEPTGKLAATGDEKGRVILWDSSTGMLLPNPPQHGAAVNVLAFSPDGKQLLSASRDWRAKLSDVHNSGTGTASRMLKHLAPVQAASFSPDGKSILTGSMDGRGRLWDVASGTLIGQPLLLQAEVHSAVFSPDGRSLALAGTGTAARIWGIHRPPAPPAPFAFPEDLYTAAFSPDGSLLATAGEGDGLCPIRLWDVATGRPRRVLAGHARTVRSLTFSSDGKRLVSGGGDGQARVWDVETGKEIYATDPTPGWVSAVALSPDGKLLLAGMRTGEVHFWDISERKRKSWLRAHYGPVFGAAFSPDGLRWLTSGMDLAARQGTTTDLQALGSPLRHQGQVWSVAFSPDGRLALTGSDDRTVRGWDATTGEALGSPLMDSLMVRLVQFSPDGKAILKGGLLDGSRLWDTATRKPLGPLMPHSGAVYACYFARDGRHVLLAGETLKAGSYAVILEPMRGSPERIALRMQLFTGMELDARDGLRMLDAEAWHDRRQRLAELPAVDDR